MLPQWTRIFARMKKVDDHQPTNEPTGDGPGKTSKPKVRRGGKSVDRQRAPSTGQVTVTVQRHVLDAFDQLSEQTGVNRQHLMREALNFYATCLAGGFRVYEVPGLRRAG